MTKVAFIIAWCWTIMVIGQGVRVCSAVLGVTN